MKLRARLTGAVLVGTLSMVGLAACGSDDSDSNTNDDTKTSETDAPSDEGSDESSSEGEDGKPSKDEVIAGYSQIINDTLGSSGALPDEIVTNVVTCFVDEVYDDASPETLQAIADADVTGVDPDDMQLFTDASTACQKQIVGG